MDKLILSNSLNRISNNLAFESERIKKRELGIHGEALATSLMITSAIIKEEAVNLLKEANENAI
jgi:hypothetical protein